MDDPAANPFATRDAPPQVAVARGPDPYANARAVLDRFELGAAAGRRVLLKPNVGRAASPGDGVTTDPRVVAAAIDAFTAAGAIVSVGESPIVGVDTMDALQRSGIAAVATERDCPLIDMDQRPCIEREHPAGVAMRAFRVCADIADHDLVVSIPVMKTHMHTGVTLAIKNMKGCLWRRSKVSLHMLDPVSGLNDKPLDLAINDMAHILRPHFALIDGTVGMEGLGPSAGAPKRCDTVLAGADPYAADAVACALMGLDPADIPHLRLGAADGLGCIDLEAIDVHPASWRELITPFATSPANPSIEFENIEILDCRSCSACQSTLMLLLKRYGDQLFDYFPEQSTVSIAIGKGHDSVPAGTLCVGNCTARHRERGVFVSGCPPVGSAIMRAIQEYFREG